jgi:hypothetical protein
MQHPLPQADRSGRHLAQAEERNKMSRFTKLDLDELPVAPRDDLGHFVGKECPECGNGKLVYEGNGHWRCDGLADPEDENKPLDACTYQHDDGDPATPQRKPQKRRAG